MSVIVRETRISEAPSDGDGKHAVEVSIDHDDTGRVGDGFGTTAQRQMSFTDVSRERCRVRDGDRPPW